MWIDARSLWYSGTAGWSSASFWWLPEPCGTRPPPPTPCPSPTEVAEASGMTPRPLVLGAGGVVVGQLLVDRQHAPRTPPAPRGVARRSQQSPTVPGCGPRPAGPPRPPPGWAASSRRTASALRCTASASGFDPILSVSTRRAGSIPPPAAAATSRPSARPAASPGRRRTRPPPSRTSSAAP